MNKFKIFIFVIGIYCLNTACTNNSKKEESKVTETKTAVIEAGDSPIRKISVLYYNYDVERDKPLTCENLKLSLPTFQSSDYKGVLDATIDSPKVLEEIKSLIASLHQSTAKDIGNDITIGASIEYENGAKDSLYIGQNTIYLNGSLFESNNRLIYLIKNNAGYYPWMIGDALGQMPELKDNSFMKEPFVSTAYYKKWQENRNADK